MIWFMTIFKYGNSHRNYFSILDGFIQLKLINQALCLQHQQEDP